MYNFVIKPEADLKLKLVIISLTGDKFNAKIILDQKELKYSTTEIDITH